MDYEYVFSFNKPQLTGNWFLDLNPLTKLNLVIAIAIFSIISKSWQVSVCIIILYFLIAAIAGKFYSFAKIYIKLGLLIGSLLFIMRAMFIPGKNILFSFWVFTITQEGINQGVWFSTLVVSLCGSLVLYSKITRAKDLMYALEKLGAPHSTTYIILSSLQSIIDLGERAKLIMDSQKARGIETEGTIFRRVKAFMPIMGPLLLGAIASTEEKAIAMDARAFSSPTKNTHMSELRQVPLWEKMVVLLINISLILFIIWRLI
ncbi:energy-coupling factor transporter transmembrane protein EcfT [Bacillus sp. RG28]|uniref:Energy-coupling factor transporter transmembrane protein EcfT n=1 Tax=Gottfriedia endophytica TaxID=2820819 RepID=A0A940NMG2_9BACI|nr:energy-coupling factor transporter transmembrane component T [Gottfriedia endophytica]MBP0724148.1 energy-coupling factor transporter transmembrane protein EcfT [Gottfriedia endophytica]